jgi:ATP-binding cassette, subfamily B, bacterial
MSNLTTTSPYFDFRNALSENRLLGLWRMMTDYRFPYIAATASLAISALAKTSVYLLLRYFADDVLGQGAMLGTTMTQTFLWIGLGFILLAFVEGGGAFLSGRLAAYTAEGITRRLRDFLFDHIQRLSFSYHSATPTGDLIERVTPMWMPCAASSQNKPSVWDASCCCSSSTGSRSCISM